MRIELVLLLTLQLLLSSTVLAEHKNPNTEHNLETIYDTIANTQIESTSISGVEHAEQYELEQQQHLAYYTYLESALSGNTEAIFRLGTLYELGGLIGEPISNETYALFWYQIAASNDHGEASIAIDRILKKEHDEIKADQITQVSDERASSNALSEESISNNVSHSSNAKLIPLVNSSNPPESNIKINGALLAFGLITLTCTILLLVKVQHLKSTLQIKPTKTKNEHTLKALHAALKKLKNENRKLDHLNQRLTSNSEDQNARVLFGFSRTEHIEVDALKARYKKLSKVFHPDHAGSIKSMQKLNKAYDHLKAHKQSSSPLS